MPVKHELAAVLCGEGVPQYPTLSQRALKISSDTREQNASSIAVNQVARCFTAHFADHRKNQVELPTLVVFALLPAKALCCLNRVGEG